jgi:hypothetical protein
MTNYWIVVHDLKAYKEHPNLIGKEIRLRGKIDSIKPRDKIVYYCTGDSVIRGTFDVVSSGYILRNDQFWIGEHVVYDIEPRWLAKEPTFVGMSNLLSTLVKPLKIFPIGKFEPIKLKGRTIVKIIESDFKTIEKALKTYVHERPFQGHPNEGKLGAPMDLGILNYAPTSEPGVVALFVHHIGKLKNHNFVKIEFIRADFPDACVIEKEKDGSYSRRYIEFEYLASGFKTHVKDSKHKKIHCDYVVCWENDYETCPIDVIALKNEDLEHKH